MLRRTEEGRGEERGRDGRRRMGGSEREKEEERRLGGNVNTCICALNY